MKIWSLTAVAAFMACPGQATGEIRFDQLSACEDLERAVASLATNSLNCRRPLGGVEQAIVARLQNTPGIRLCWLRQAPTNSLARFSCLRVGLPSGFRSLDCISPASTDDVTEYRENYERSYARVASNYTRAASGCGVGNGNATRAVRTLMSFTLATIARFDLGFVLPIGRGLVGEGVILHGFGSVDPEIGAEMDELEFVSIWRR